MKQTPLVFVLITSRRSDDYCAILSNITTWLESSFSVQSGFDCERAMWIGIKTWKRKSNELHTKHSGCTFHLNPAFHRAFKELKLPKDEHGNRAVRK